MSEQTHKWLPSEPTPAMLEAEQFASSLAYESHEVQVIEVYKTMWQAAGAAKREPLSIDTVMSIVGSMPWEELYTEEDEWNYFARAIEKAHGIGE
jgi:hypothetical protein